MGEDELFQQIKNGRQEAMRQWIALYGQDVAKWAFQYGHTVEDASDLTIQTFRQLFKDTAMIEHEYALWRQMVQIAIQKLTDYEQSTINEFIFEEDERLHKELMQFSHIEKLVLIFTVFSDEYREKVKDVLHLSEEEIQRKQTEAMEKIEGVQIEKRLQLLRKSYQRMRFQLNADAVFSADQVEKADVEQVTFKSSKRNLIMLFVGIVMLISLTLFSVLNSEAFKAKRFEQSIEQQKEAYTEKRTATIDQLGLSEEQVQYFGLVGLFDNQYLSKEQEAKFDRFIEGIEQDIEQENPLNKKEVNKRFSEFMEQLKTPHELAMAVIKNPLTDNFDASERFLEQYIQRYYALNAIYVEVISEQPEIQKEMFKNEDEFTPLNVVLEDQDSLPKEVEQILQKMAEQNMYFDLQVDQTNTDGKAFFKQLRNALHPDVGGYITMLEFSDLDSYWLSMNETTDPFSHISEFEETLLLTTMKEEIKQLLEVRYVNDFMGILGKENPNLYSEKGVISQKHQKEWREFIKSEPDRIVTQVLKKVIQEFEETNWQVSKTQIYFNWSQVRTLVSGAKLVGMEDFDWETIQNTEFDNIHLPNKGYDYLVDEAFQQLKEGQPTTKIDDPLMITSVFLRALNLGDTAFLQQLSGGHMKPDVIEKILNVGNR